jgi:hypothetical protein
MNGSILDNYGVLILDTLHNYIILSSYLLVLGTSNFFVFPNKFCHFLDQKIVEKMGKTNLFSNVNLPTFQY